MISLQTKYRSRLLSVIVLLLVAGNGRAQISFVDTHVHFNWDQKEITDAISVVEKLRRADVEFAVVSSTPSALALELVRAADGLIVPIFSPYTHELGRQDWYLDQQMVEKARAGLEKGLYHGIGEVHFMTGFKPRTDNLIFRQLMLLAIEFDVPALVHIDSGSEKALLDICLQYPELKLVFAHAGGNLRATHIRKIINNCENVFIEFSARDPWRFGGLTDTDDCLLPAWRELVIAYPDRFITGTDPVWKVTRTQTWDQADDGWEHYEKLIQYHRNWIADLPPEVQDKVASVNARRLYGPPEKTQ